MGSCQNDIARSDFPNDFIFGAATSAYQIEGAWNIGGKGRSNWDCFTEHTPGGTADGSNGCVAIDHYNRFKEDVDLMKKLGVDSYRFSISWTRILPGGKLCAGICKDGIQFYNDLIDTLIEAGIEPCATLFHWDVPQRLEDEYGGFLSRKIVKDFCEFAEVCFWEFGDRVKKWITLNEPWSFTNGGYIRGKYPPCHGALVDVPKELPWGTYPLPRETILDTQRKLQSLLPEVFHRSANTAPHQFVTHSEEDMYTDLNAMAQDMDQHFPQGTPNTNPNTMAQDMARAFLEGIVPHNLAQATGIDPNAVAQDMAHTFLKGNIIDWGKDMGIEPNALAQDMASAFSKRIVAPNFAQAMRKDPNDVAQEMAHTLAKDMGIDPNALSRGMACSSIGSIIDWIKGVIIDWIKELARRLFPKGNPGTEPYIVAHNLILAHAYAVDIYRRHYQKHQGGKIGMTNVSMWCYPYRKDNPEDKKAALRAIDFMMGWFVAPVTKGDYPASMREIVGLRLPRFTKEEVALVKGSCDFLGINYYTTYYGEYQPYNPFLPPHYDNDKQVKYVFERDRKPIGPQAGSKWLYIVPEGIYHLMLHVKDTYNNPDIYITENGVDEKNKKITISEALKDEMRINYHKDHLKWLKEAMNHGVRVKGYFLWSLLDNFEWAEGYTVRFGVYYVNFVNGRLTRFPKNSARWWMNFLNKPQIPWNNLFPWKQLQDDEKTEGKPVPAGKRPRIDKVST